MANAIYYQGIKYTSGADSADPGTGGGHEILNDVGASMPQKDKLQFTGGLNALDDAGKTTVGVADYPVQPVNMYPADGQQDVEERPVFQSSQYAHVFGLVPMYGYQLKVFDSSNLQVFDSGNLEQAQPQFTMPSGVLQVGQTYSWQVRYQSGNLKWSPWSEKTSFTTEAAFLTTSITRPSIITPYDGQVLNSQTPTILTSQFDSVGGLIQGDGDFEVSGDPTFATVADSGTGINSYTVQTPLSHGQQYFARARHKDNPYTTDSPWSPRVSFAIKSLYRDTRIGIAIKPATLASRRIGRDYSQIGIDAGYFPQHPIWANWSLAGREVYTFPTPLQDITDFGVVKVMKTWIKSGPITTGPYAGWHGVMVDYADPTPGEQADGWHICDVFYNPITSSYEEYIKYGTESFPANKAGIAYNTLKNSVLPAMNSDPAQELTRGWHLMTWREYFFLRVLGYIEYGGPKAWYSSVSASGEYRGCRIMPTPDANNALADPVFVDGLWNSQAIDIDSATNLSIPPVVTGGPMSGNQQYKDITGIYSSARQSPALDLLHIDDYVIPESVNGAMSGYANGAYPPQIFANSLPTALSGQSAHSSASYLNTGGAAGIGFGFLYEGGTQRAILCKWY
jgi:hypothetical protein